MKRQFRLIGLVALVVLSACNSKSKGPTDTYSSGVVTIAADESFEPIIQEEIEVFENLYPLAGIVPRYTTEVEAINLLLKDSVRLAITTRTLTKEEMNSFHSRKFFPREIKLATDGLALIVNRANPDSLLSVRDFRRILTGEVKNWKEVNPDSRLKGIQVVFDNKNSSTVRFAISPSLIESVAGCVLPVLILAIMEVWSARKKYEDNGYQAICEYTDPEADREPTLKEKKAVLIYSHLAVNCFCITIGVVALLLIGLLIAGDPKTLAVKGIVIGSIVLMIAMILAYVIYRIIYARRLKMSS